jgi:hypothetical protein
MPYSPHKNNFHLTRQAIIWRLALTILLLLFLAGSGLTIFKSATTRPEASVLPTLTIQTGLESQEVIIDRHNP